MSNVTAKGAAPPSQLRKASSQPLTVVRVRTKQTLCLPDYANLFMRGAGACGYQTPSALLAELCLNPGAETTGLFFGLSGQQPRCVAVGFIPVSAFWLAAAVSLAYSEGEPRQLAALVGKRLREWFIESGHNHVLVANLFHTDRSYLVGLNHFGKPSKVGDVIRFDF